MKAARLLLSVSLLATALGAAAAEPQRIPVLALKTTPTIDGDLSEWGSEGWHRVAIAPTVKPSERAELGLAAEDRNAVGNSVVELKAGAIGGRIYFAVRWPDDAPDTDLDVWSWNGSRYVRFRRHEDKFAMRFKLAGEYDRSMLSGKNYEADVWLWSASLSDSAGIAEDFHHVISTRMIENAAEYTVKGIGTIYIKKYRDEGTTAFRTRRPPRTREADEIVAVEQTGRPDGSYADVTAKGHWQQGRWSLELSRALDTGHPDDAVLPAGGTILGQIAVFNHASAENKSVSEPLLIDLSAVK